MRVNKRIAIFSYLFIFQSAVREAQICVHIQILLIYRTVGEIYRQFHVQNRSVILLVFEFTKIIQSS